MNIAHILKENRMRRLLVGGSGRTLEQLLIAQDQRIQKLEALVTGSKVSGPKISGADLPTHRIRKVIADHYDIAVEELVQRTRSERLVWPRFVGIYFSRLLLGTRYKMLATLYGRKDHTTVPYAIAQVENRISTEQAFRDDVMLVESKIKEELNLP